MGVPNLIAHRGYAHRYPENTLAGLEAALRAGARWVEFDVQLSSDHVPVVIHDGTLERTAGVEGRVFEKSVKTLGGLAAHEPDRFGDQFKGVTIPTLGDVCELIRSAQGVTAFVELKEESIEAHGAEVAVAAILQVLERYGGVARFVLISYDLDALALAREAGWSAVGGVLRTWDDESRREAESLRPDYLFCNVRKIPDLDRPFWPGSWWWAVYEIENAKSALVWGERGADFVETFRIGEVSTDPLWIDAGGARARL